jgi:hypothetical protein
MLSLSHAPIHSLPFQHAIHSNHKRFNNYYLDDAAGIGLCRAHAAIDLVVRIVVALSPTARLVCLRHRLHLVRELAEIAQSLESVQEVEENVFVLLDELKIDQEAVIRQALVDQLPHFAQYLVDVCRAPKS